ncbi:MAG: MbnP family protein [Flavipsychrobacter sp.]
MSTLKRISFLALALVFATVYSCRKDDNPTPQDLGKGSMKLQFEYVWAANEAPFQLEKEYVHPKTGDTMTFTTLKFYVSNIKLQRADGSWWAQPDSYHLICNSCTDAADKYIMVIDIPNGNYVAMEYTMGVDSLMNVSGAHTGALSFSNGMFWDWNTGYIMMKAEGKSPNSPNGNYQLHFGGFKGDYNVVTTKTADMSNSKLTVSSGQTKTVTLKANPAKLWHSSEGLSKVYIIHSESAVAKQMATDFYNGIYLKSVE